MQLDYDLLRTLLLQIEDKTDGFASIPANYFCEQLAPEDSTKVLYHLKYLPDAGLVEHARKINIIDITPLGREYLNNIRDDTIWAKTKKKCHPLASISLSVLSDVARSIEGIRAVRYCMSLYIFFY